MSQNQIMFDCRSIPEAQKLFSYIAKRALKLEFENAQLKRERSEKDKYIKACEKRENDLIDRIRAGL
jgi:hypothetical protein